MFRSLYSTVLILLRRLALAAVLALPAMVSAQPPGAAVPATPLRLTLQDAMERARVYGQQVYSANIAAQIAHEDAVQAKAGLLPTVNWFNQMIYTQPNGTPSGVFVANDGPHIYNNQALVHGDIFAPSTPAAIWLPGLRR
jgi:outer membrane protein TolC